MRNPLERIVSVMIRVILAAAVFVLFLHSIFSTSFIGQIAGDDGGVQDHTLNIADSPWKHLAILLLLTVVMVPLYRGCRKRRIRINRRAALWIMAAAGFALGTAWILMTRFLPGSDPAKVCRVAAEWQAGDFSAFERGDGYLFKYPFQSGIVLFYSLLMGIFGTENFVCMQLVNLLALAAAYWLMVRIMERFWKEDGTVLFLVHGALILWAPLMFYVTYLYGILPGMACSLGALYCTVRFLETRSCRYMLPAALLMGLATVFKMNCLIYLVAMGCFLLYDAAESLWSRKRQAWKRCLFSLLFLAAMCLGVGGTNLAVNRYVEHLSGYEMPEGQVMLSWVVMGLQEAPKGPGNYNGYNGNVFAESNYDTALANERSKEELKEILRGMRDNPVDNGLVFFARKTAYQWNDPTFISLDRMEGRHSEISISPVVKSLIEGKGKVFLSIALNLVQTLILAGTLFYLAYTKKGININELIILVVFLGGFLFHLVWEASASYAIPYFVLLIPYAVKGMAEYVRWADRAWSWAAGRTMEQKKEDIRHFFSGENMPLIGGVVLLVLLLVIFGQSNLFRRTIALNDDLRGIDASGQFYQTGEWEQEF